VHHLAETEIGVAAGRQAHCPRVPEGSTHSKAPRHLAANPSCHEPLVVSSRQTTWMSSNRSADPVGPLPPHTRQVTFRSMAHGTVRRGAAEAETTAERQWTGRATPLGHLFRPLEGPPSPLEDFLPVRVWGSPERG
jgi:hypothetical protein